MKAVLLDATVRASPGSALATEAKAHLVHGHLEATLERGASELVGRGERRTPAADDGYLRR